MVGIDSVLSPEMQEVLKWAGEQKALVLGLMAGGAVFSEGVRYAIGAHNLRKGVHRKRIVIWSASFLELNGPHGPTTVRFTPEGDEYELDRVFGNPTVERAIVRATRKSKDGILRLPPKAHERMMDILEAHVRGNEPIGNAALRHGRPTHDDRDSFMPTYFTEEGEDGVDDDHLTMVRIILVAKSRLMGDLQNAEFCEGLVPEFDQYKTAVKMLAVMAAEAVASTQAHRGTAAVRHVVIHTAKFA